MDRKKLLSSIQHYLIMLARMFVPKLKHNLTWLIREDDALAYTYRKKGNSNVFINPFHPILDELSLKEWEMSLLGLDVHENLHQLLTNFIAFEKQLKKTESEKQALFKEVFNIFEDSRIEAFSPSYFGGASLTALEFVIEYIWKQSPDIEGGTFQEVLNAMIQWGDMGIVKGKFSSSEGEDLFNQIIPLFGAAIESEQCVDCIKYAKEATDLLFPFMPKSYAGSSSSSGESDGEGSDAEAGEASSASSKKASRRKSDIEKAKKANAKKENEKKEGASGTSKKDEKETSGSNSDDKTASAEKDSSSTDDGTDSSAAETSSTSLSGSSSGDGFEEAEEFEVESDDAEVFERAAAELEKELERLQNEELAEEEENKSDFDFEPVETDSDELYANAIYHFQQSACEETYESYVERLSDEINELTDELAPFFISRPGKVRRTDHGALNLRRYKDPTFTSPRIFDKKKPREEVAGSVCLLIDESGSMHGTKIGNARIAAIILAETMAALNVPCCIIGHTADHKHHSSLELMHYTTFKNAYSDRTALALVEARSNNRDGAAIRYCTKLLKERNDKNKLLIVISDGQPAASNYSGEEAIRDTESALREARRVGAIAGLVICPGYGEEILETMYGNEYIEIQKATDLKDKLAEVVINAVSQW